MNKNIIKLFAILVMCFMIGAVLVGCGAQGEKGDTGAAGVQGEKGDKGDKGDAGPIGDQGPKGEDAYVCANHVWDTQTITVTEHYYDKGTGKESAGSYLRVCVVCGWAEFVKGEHTFGEEVVVAPDCDEEGYTEKTCSECGYTEQYDKVEALGHKIAVAWDENNIDASWVAREKVAGVCPLVQATIYDARCTVCGEIADTKTVNAVGHQVAVEFDKDNIDACWRQLPKDDAVCDCEEDTHYEADCVACGETVFNAMVEATGHSYVNFHPTINKVDAPSHTVNKIEVAPCETCPVGCGCPMGEKIVEEATGHTWGEWYFVDGVMPTLNSGATARRDCIVCKEEGYVDYGTKSEKFSNVQEVELTVLAEDNADYNVDVEVEDDCITNRVVTFTHKETGLVIANVTIPNTMSGHAVEGECTVVTLPDRYNAGVATIACKTCGEVLVYTLPALGFKDSTVYNTQKIENADAFCEEIEYTYSIVIAGNDNGSDTNGSFTFSTKIAGDDHHDPIPDASEWQYVISEDKKTISTVYWCEGCEHWIVIDTNPNPDYVEE